MTEERAASMPWAPLAVVVAAAVAVLLQQLWPLPWFGSPLADLLLAFGILAALAGIWLIYGGVTSLRSAGTTVAPMRRSEHLATAGVYRITRNPIYLGMVLLAMAAGLLSGIVWFLATGLLAGLAITRLSIVPEERHLAQRFGKRYRDYQKSVRRWI